MKRLFPLLLACAALGAGAAARAQSTFSLAPVVLSADPGRSLVTSVTFTNTSPKTVKVEASVMSWSQVDGQHTETPTRDLLLNPSTFTVGPGESQLIRVGLRRKPTSGELTYRLHLDQRSLAASPEAAQAPSGAAQAPAQDAETAVRGSPDDPASAPEIQTRIEQLFAVTLPVYFAPGTSAPKLEFSVTPRGADLVLDIQNAGNRHETMYDLTFTRAGQSLSFPPNAVLSGSRLSYVLKDWAQLSGAVSVQYRSAEGEVARATLP